MALPIRLKIMSRQFDYDNYDPADGKNEPSETFEEMEIVCDGVLTRRDGRVEIRYQESENTGMQGSVTSVSYAVDSPGVITMLRSGTVSTALVFREGERTVCTYEIPEGRLDVTVYTRRMENRITDGDGMLSMDYYIEIGGIRKLRTQLKLFLFPADTQQG